MPGFLGSAGWLLLCCLRRERHRSKESHKVTPLDKSPLKQPEKVTLTNGTFPWARGGPAAQTRCHPLL